MLSSDQVRHIATLARLGLSDAEVEKFSRQLSDIFQYIEKLNEVNTDQVEPTFQVTGLENVVRPDDVKPFSSRDQLLACSPLPLQNDQVLVENVIVAHE